MKKQYINTTILSITKLIEQNHTCSEFLKDEEWDRNIERTEMKGFCQK
jgi:hypothetical protein